ncbi:hypothetical protein D3C87_2035350 [compost metagenome]
MLIRALLATANMVMKPKISTGKFGAPAWTTLSKGVSPSPNSSGDTNVIAEIDTST